MFYKNIIICIFLMLSFTSSSANLLDATNPISPLNPNNPAGVFAGTDDDFEAAKKEESFKFETDKLCVTHNEEILQIDANVTAVLPAGLVLKCFDTRADAANFIADEKKLKHSFATIFIPIATISTAIIIYFRKKLF